MGISLFWLEGKVPRGSLRLYFERSPTPIGLLNEPKLGDGERLSSAVDVPRRQRYYPTPSVMGDLVVVEEDCHLPPLKPFLFLFFSPLPFVS